MTPLPSLDRTSPTFRSDLDAFFLTKIPTFVTEANALQDDITAKAGATTTAVDAAFAAGLPDAAANAAQTTSDRTQTGKDRSATGMDRSQTGLDRAAVNAALASIAGGPVASVNGKPGPNPVLDPGDIAPAATPAEMAAGTVTDYRSMSPALVAGAIGARGAAPGDMLTTARTLGAEWLSTSTVYLQSAYTALFAVLGLVPDTPVGTVWSALAVNPTDSGSRSSVVTLANGTVLEIYGTGTKIYRSTNKGLSFTVVHDTAVSPGGSTYAINQIVKVTETILIAVGTNSILLRSVNAGLTWTPRAISGSYNGQEILYCGLRITDSIVIVGGSNAAGSYYWRSTDAGATFTEIGGSAGFGANAAICGFALVAGSTSVIFAIGNDGYSLYRSVNAGLTFTIASGISISQMFINYRPVAMYAPDMNTLIYGGTGGSSAYGLWKVFYNGSAWTSSAFAAFYQTGAVNSIVDLGGGSILATGNSQWYKSTDYGVSWTPPVTGRSIFDTEPTRISPFSSSEVIVVSAAGKNYRSSDFSYDSSTQFKTPNPPTIVGARTYIKA